MVDYNIILLIIVVIIIIFINTLDNIKKHPLKILGSKYNEINIKINKQEIYNKKKKGSLLVVSHNYKHNDIFIIQQELFNNVDSTCMIVGQNAWWNKILYSLCRKNISLFPNNESNADKAIKTCIFIGITNNTVDKLNSYMNQGYNVIMFYTNYSKKTGIYNLIKLSNCDVYTGRITNNECIKAIDTKSWKNDFDIIFNSMNKHFNLEYNTFDKPGENELAEEYMLRLKKHLYETDIL